MSGFDTFFNTMANQSADRFNRKVALDNAKLSDAAAQDALNRGSMEAQRSRLKSGQLAGQQEAAYGASGVTNAGSPADVMRDTSLMSELDAQTIRNNAAREAWGYKTQGQHFLQQAALLKNKELLDTAAGGVSMAVQGATGGVDAMGGGGALADSSGLLSGY